MVMGSNLGGENLILLFLLKIGMAWIGKGGENPKGWKINTKGLK